MYRVLNVARVHQRQEKERGAFSAISPKCCVEALTKNRKKKRKKNMYGTGEYEKKNTKLLPRECVRGQNQKLLEQQKKKRKENPTN